MMKLLRMKWCSKLFSVLMLLSSCSVGYCVNLKCYSCGDIEKGISCADYSNVEPIICPDKDDACQKTVVRILDSRPIVVRSCGPMCSLDEAIYSDVFCCRRDYCNSTVSVLKIAGISKLLMIVALIIALLCNVWFY